MRGGVDLLLAAEQPGEEGVETTEQKHQRRHVQDDAGGAFVIDDVGVHHVHDQRGGQQAEPDQRPHQRVVGRLQKAFRGEYSQHEVHFLPFEGGAKCVYGNIKLTINQVASRTYLLLPCELTMPEVPVFCSLLVYRSLKV